MGSTLLLWLLAPVLGANSSEKQSGRISEQIPLWVPWGLGCSRQLSAYRGDFKAGDKGAAWALRQRYAQSIWLLA